VLDFLLLLIELFSPGVTADALRANNGLKSRISFERGPVDSIFQVEGIAPHQPVKRLPEYDSLDYKCRLMRLHVDSLKLRRLRYDLIYTYKVVFGLVSGAASDLFTLTSLTLLVHEVTLTNFTPAVTVSTWTCTHISFRSL